jgi:hypothetical protein
MYMFVASPCGRSSEPEMPTCLAVSRDVSFA